jgi:hypothetical protein
MKLGRYVLHPSTRKYGYGANRKFPKWPPNPRWRPYISLWFNINQHNTYTCSQNTFKWCTKVLYPPWDTIPIMIHLNISKMAAKFKTIATNSIKYSIFRHMSIISIVCNKEVLKLCILLYFISTIRLSQPNMFRIQDGHH